MGFLDDFGQGLGSVFKPIWTKAEKIVNLGDKVSDAAINVTGRVADAAPNLANSLINGVEGLGNFLSNPLIFLIGGVVVMGIVLKVL